MDKNKIKERLELALRPAKPPALEEVLEQVSTRGVLRGPVDWVFPAWRLYVEYATQRIIDMFQLTEEEKRQLLHFRDTTKQMLLEAQIQTKEKLKALYKTIKDGRYRIEENRLYAPNGTWLYTRGAMLILKVHGISVKAYFPDLLKLPREKLELLQLGWRASDEGNKRGRPFMGTTQPWQVFAWTATRYGELYIHIDFANLTREGVSIAVHLRANSWRQMWNKDEAINLVMDYLRHGEWTPLLTMWLGDGDAGRKKVLRGEYRIIVANKEPWKLGINAGSRRAIVAKGKEAFVKLREVAGVYGMLLDALQFHKWIVVKLATDDKFRATYKLKPKRRIDILRKLYGYNDSGIPLHEPERDAVVVNAIVVAGIVLRLSLVSNQSGWLRAEHYTRDVKKAFAIAERLESAGLRPNIIRAGPYYMVYITMTDLLKLAEKDEAVRKAIVQYLAEKAKNGNPKQRETAEKILKRYPLF
jgi:hypothetical protein